MQKTPNAIVVLALATVLAGLAGCASAINMKKETPASKSLASYQKIWVGWLDLRPADYEKYGFESAEIWKGEIHKFNTAGVLTYLKENLGDRIMGGAQGPDDQAPAEADLAIKLVFEDLVQRHDEGLGGVDEMHLSVEVVDTAAQEPVYRASMFVTSAAPFPRNWKGQNFDGRVDNEVWNLANFLADKLQ